VRKVIVNDLKTKLKDRSSSIFQAPAFTLVELLVSVVVLGIAAGAIVQASNIALSSSKRSGSTTEVQNLVSRDLNWLRWYGKAWNCTSGSYATCVNQSPSTVLRYDDNQACSTLVANFLTAASNANLEGDDPNRPFPPRPFPVPSAAGTAQQLQVVNGTPLTRTIRLATTSVASAQPRSVEVAYSYGGQPPFERFASVLIQAGGWCNPGNPS